MHDWGVCACFSCTALSVAFALVAAVFMYIHAECASSADCYGGLACVGGQCNCTDLWANPPYRCDPTFSTRPSDLKIDVFVWMSFSFLVSALLALCCSMGPEPEETRVGSMTLNNFRR